MKIKSILKNNQGQSTLEFALTMILLLAFVLFYFQISMIFAFGNYVHYATFMAARAYLAGSDTYEDQQARAKSVMLRLVKKSEGQAGLDKFPFIAKGIQGQDPKGVSITPPQNYVATDFNFSWLQGVRYTFRSKLFLIPLAGTGKAGQADSSDQPASTKGPPNTVTLTSESWLGKEPANDECRAYMGKGSWFFDNGC